MKTGLRNKINKTGCREWKSNKVIERGRERGNRRTNVIEANLSRTE